MTEVHALKCKKDPCTCDGYHTFDELYSHRIELYIALCRVIRNSMKNIPVWKSMAHSDGTEWKGWFIMGIYEGSGAQITYHLPMEKWKDCGFARTLDCAPIYDGHTSDDVLTRLSRLV